MRILFYFLFFTLISCSNKHVSNQVTLNFKDNTGCFSRDDIYTALKLSKIEICSIERYDNLTKGCDGIFYLNICEWKKGNTNRNYVCIPVLKTGQTIFVNPSLKRKKSNSILTDLEAFKKEAKTVFEESELKQMEEIYLYGVQTFPKGRLAISN